MLGVPYSEGRQCIVGWRAEGGGEGGGVKCAERENRGGEGRYQGGGWRECLIHDEGNWIYISFLVSTSASLA